MNTLRNRIRTHFENGFSFYFILALVLIVGVIVGALITKGINKETLRTLVDFSNPYFLGLSKGFTNKIDFLKISIFLNIIFTVITYLLGLLGLGVLIPIILFLRGLQHGVVVGYVILNFGFKGFIVSIFGLYPQYLLFIPSLISISSLSMMVSFKYRMNSGIRQMKINRINLYDYTVLVTINTFVLMLGSLYEGLIGTFFLNLLSF